MAPYTHHIARLTIVSPVHQSSDKTEYNLHIRMFNTHTHTHTHTHIHTYWKNCTISSSLFKHSSLVFTPLSYASTFARCCGRFSCHESSNDSSGSEHIGAVCVLMWLCVTVYGRTDVTYSRKRVIKCMCKQRERVRGVKVCCAKQADIDSHLIACGEHNDGIWWWPLHDRGLRSEVIRRRRTNYDRAALQSDAIRAYSKKLHLL